MRFQAANRLDTRRITNIFLMIEAELEVFKDFETMSIVRERFICPAFQVSHDLVPYETWAVAEPRGSG